MATYGKLEAQITIPTGGWIVNAMDSFGLNVAVTIPAGTYYHSTAGSNGDTFAEALTDAFTNGMLDTWTVTFSGGEQGNGIYTFTCTAVCDIYWTTNTALGDLLGFSGDVVGSTTHSGTVQAKGVWFASYPWQKKNAKAGGTSRVSDQQIAMNSNGNVFSVIGRDYKWASIVWPMEKREKCWTCNEVTANESFETFLVDGIWGKSGWGTSTGPIRFHPDADDDTDFGTFSVLGLESWDPNELVEHWAQGCWRIELPRLIEVPT